MVKVRFFALPEGARFSNKDLIVFLLPVIFEQLMLGCMGVADTSMVSSLGETAVAGVALVNRIDTFAKQFFLALGQGGSVVLAQYIGANDNKLARSSLKNNITIVTSIGILFMLVMVIFKTQMLNLFFGGASKEVLGISEKYFSITAISYPFAALYYACSSEYRVMRRSNITFIGSLAMMSINIALKYIFIFVMKMGIIGAALSTLVAMGVVGFALLFELKSKRNCVNITNIYKLDFSGEMSWKILKVSVPNGIEQGMFQLGALLIAGVVSRLGTVAIAADQIARAMTPFVLCVTTAFTSLMMMVIGQCMGAKDVEGAKNYIKHISKLNYFMTTCNAIIFLIFLNPIISLFDVSAEAKEYAIRIMILYSICAALFYPSSFGIPGALRGAGDTKFVMIVSGASMLLFRVGTVYVFTYTFDMGIMGTWVAMVTDWVIRSVIFYIRVKNGKWRKNVVI